MNEQLPPGFWQSASYVLSGLLLGTLGWLGNRNLQRLDAVEKAQHLAPTKEDINKVHERLDDLCKLLGEKTIK